MMRIFLKVGVPSSASPFKVTIKDEFGQILAYKPVIGTSCFFIECCSAYLYASAASPSGDYYPSARFIKLQPFGCLSLSVNFDPNKKSEALQTFHLSDGNYGFPIEDAVLYFNG